MFQSLFSWNSLSDCVRSLSLQFYILFQSLFSWNSLSDVVGVCLDYFVLMFQSLFSWNSLSDSTVLMDQLEKYEMVSILVFVELALGQTSPVMV